MQYMFYLAKQLYVDTTVIFLSYLDDDQSV